MTDDPAASLAAERYDRRSTLTWFTRGPDEFTRNQSDDEPLEVRRARLAALAGGDPDEPVPETEQTHPDPL